MRPLSSLNYIRANKGRSAIVIFMLFMTVMVIIAGNYIASVDWYWEKAIEYDGKAVLISALSTDEDFVQFDEVVEELSSDNDLTVIRRSAYGHSGIEWECTMGFDMGSVSYVVDNAEDLKTLFDRFGIECDYSNIGDRSAVISKTLAANRGLELGGTLDYNANHSITGEYTIDALIDDDSFIVFYVDSAPMNNYRAYVLSDTLSDHELRDHVKSVIGDRKVKVERALADDMAEQMSSFYVMFYLGVFLLALMLSVTVNSVLTGHFVKRTYEFGVYRALGLTKRNVRNKVFCEIMVMDLIAIAIGVAGTFLLTFLLNELLYQPSGKYLPYCSAIGIVGALLANLTVIVPTIILKGRRMAKADVTEF